MAFRKLKTLLLSLLLCGCQTNLKNEVNQYQDMDAKKTYLKTLNKIIYYQKQLLSNNECYIKTDYYVIDNQIYYFENNNYDIKSYSCYIQSRLITMIFCIYSVKNF